MGRQLPSMSYPTNRISEKFSVKYEIIPIRLTPLAHSIWRGYRKVRLKIFLLSSVLLPFIEPCSATRPLREIVRKDLINNFAVSISSEELLQKIQKLSNDYEDKILKNLQRLSNALMQDLLVFLQEDALSLDGIRAKIVASGYQDFKNKKAHGGCFTLL